MKTNNNVFFGLFFSSAKALSNIMIILDKLEEELMELQAMSNKVEALIMFYNLIIPLQEKRFLFDEIRLMQKYASKGRKKQINTLKSLRAWIESVDLSEFGITTASNADLFTEDDVYLGNIFCIPIETAAYFLSRQKEMESEMRPDASKDYNDPVSNWYLINDYQCGSFLKKNINEVINQIQTLKTLQK